MLTKKNVPAFYERRANRYCMFIFLKEITSVGILCTLVFTKKKYASLQKPF